MLDLEELLKANRWDIDDFRLLSSRAVLERVLTQHTPQCNVVFERCTEALKEWHERRVQTDQSKRADWVADHETIVIAWIHLFAEVCRGEHHPDRCAACAPRGSTIEVPREQSLLRLLAVARDEDRLLDEVTLGRALRPARDQRTPWQECANKWDSLLLSANPDRGTKEAPERGLTRTDVGQVFVLHLLEAVLCLYDKTKVLSKRAKLHLLLIPLLRSVYRYPDKAHSIYSRYFYGSEDARKVPGDRAFHFLYHHDLGVMEDFQSRDIAKRSELLLHVQQAAAADTTTVVQKDDAVPSLPPALIEAGNRILHGETNLRNNVRSPKPKMTRLTQLTCLIRKIESHIGTAADAARPYRSSFEDLHYRSADVISESPEEFVWKEMGTKDTFLNLVKERYAPGHEVAFLSALFDAGRDGRNSVPIWIRDGEITFLWLLTALQKTEVHVDRWLAKQPLAEDLAISRGEVTGETARTESVLSLGRSFDDFAGPNHANLVDPNGRPGPKLWAFVNFLERLALYDKPGSYKDAPAPHLKGDGDSHSVLNIATALYETLAAKADDLSIEHLREACRMAKPHLNTLPKHFFRASRLHTYLLEVFLRDRQPTPYTLFFYPLSYDTLETGRVVPAAFLAGTMAGLEWSFFPTVAQRQNYHLFALLDAIRPIIDFEIGRVLANDQRRFATEARLAAKESADRAQAEKAASTYAAMLPSLDRLSDIFKTAHSHVQAIQAAIDPLWSGLFTRATADALADVFRDGWKGQIAKRRHPEPQYVTGGHDIITAGEQRQRLYTALVYLAREKSEYTNRLPLGDEKEWAPAIVNDVVNANLKNYDTLFSKNLFLRSLVKASCTSPEESGLLHALLKLLTVDAGAAGRPVHLAQVAAALGMSARETRWGDSKSGPDEAPILSGNRRLKNRVIVMDPGAPEGRRIIPGVTFSPLFRVGVQELVAILALDAHGRTASATTHPLSTAALEWAVTLPASVEPYVFLRSLRVFAGDALRATGQDYVTCVDWILQLAHGHLKIFIECRGHFSTDTKTALWEFQRKESDEYHNLRSNFRDLCRTVGSFPLFITAQMPLQDFIPETADTVLSALSTETRFIVAEGLRTPAAGDRDGPHATWLGLLVGEASSKGGTAR